MITDITTLRNHLKKRKIIGNDVIAIMTALRNQLEVDGKKSDFEWLNHFCNWCVHVQLSKSIVSLEIINSFIRAFLQIKVEYAGRTPDGSIEYDGDLESLNGHFAWIIDKFRDELTNFFNMYQIDKGLLENEEYFIQFCAMIFYLVKNRPLHVPHKQILNRHPQENQDYLDLCDNFAKSVIWAKDVYVSPDLIPIGIEVIHNNVDGTFALRVETKHGSAMTFNPITYQGRPFRILHNNN
jgi:hypothetical protein